MASFQNISSSWPLLRFGDLIKEFKGGASIKPIEFKDTGFPVLPKGGVGSGGILRIENEKQQYVNDVSAKNYKNNIVDSRYTVIILRDLVPSGPSIGYMVKITDSISYILAQGVYAFQLNEELADADFFIQLSNSPSYRKLMNEIMVGSTQVHITNTVFHNLKFPVPSLEEQRRIAKILSTWDSAIEKLTKLIELKEKRKKGLMEKLLSGEVRFGEFNAGWSRKQIKELGKVVSGGTPSTTEPKYWDGDINWCTPTDITALKGEIYIGNTVKRITGEGLKNSSATVLPLMSLIVCTRATIGICAINKFEMSTNQGFKSVITNHDTDVLFLYYLISHNRPVLMERSNGSTFLEISKSDFESIELDIPDFSEQKRISKLLFSCDQEITSLKTERDLLVDQKSGMMEQLLTER